MFAVTGGAVNGPEVCAGSRRIPTGGMVSQLLWGWVLVLPLPIDERSALLNQFFQASTF